MKILDGKKLATEIRAEVRREVDAFKSQYKKTPTLGIILAGDDPASHQYVNLKIKACEEVGIVARLVTLPENTTTKEVVHEVSLLNNDRGITAILVQIPLPPTVNEHTVVMAMNVNKDVDGFHPTNIAKMKKGEQPVVSPVIGKGIIRLIQNTEQSSLGKKALIVCKKKSVLIDPLQTMFFDTLQIKAMVTAPEDSDFLSKVRAADILVTAVNQRHIITHADIKEGALVIDAGTIKAEGKTFGNVDPRGLEKKSGWITPVPGGVGPMTVAYVLKNTLELAELQEFRRNPKLN